jgi:hypothetical protein
MEFQSSHDLLFFNASSLKYVKDYYYYYYYIDIA